jgi:predicted transcriptional regulator of viral defense system
LSKLVAYAERFGEKGLAQRVGFLLEFLEIADENVLRGLAQLAGKAYVKLDLMSGEEGKYLARWRLKVNLPKEALTEWQRYWND